MVLVTGVYCSADVFNFNSSGTDARLVTEPSGLRDDNNGGNTATGALIGVNPGGVDNFMLYRIDDGFNFGSIAGETVESATLTFTALGIPGNSGSAEDLINLHEIFLSNAGWVSGTGVISGSDTPADDGSVSFANRVQYNGSGISEAWQDAGGNDVSNLLGAMNQIGSQPGYTTAGTIVTFNLDPLLAQDWVDNGLAGIALSATDMDGNSQSRFNFVLDAANLTIVTAVPEPSSLLLLGSFSFLALIRRRR